MNTRHANTAPYEHEHEVGVGAGRVGGEGAGTWVGVIRGRSMSRGILAFIIDSEHQACDGLVV